MKKAILTLAAVCIAAAVCAQGEILKLDLKPGDVFNQRLETTSNITQTMQGQLIEISNLIQGELRYAVTGIEEGNFVMDVCYTKLSMSMSSPANPMMNMSGSSETPDADDMFSPMLAIMTGKTFQMTMKPSGAIAKIEGLEKMYEGFADLETFKSLPPEVYEQIVGQVKKSYGGSFKRNMEMGTAMFPEEPVSPGDSWDMDFFLDDEISMNMRTNYTLVEKTADRIVIRAETTVDTGDSAIEMNGMSIKYNLGGTMSSEMKLDPASLWTVASESRMGIEGSLSVSHPQMSMEVPMKFESTISYANF